MPRSRYRWVVLGVGTAAQTTASMAFFSVAILAPTLRRHFDLSLHEIGIVLAAFTIGMTPTLLPWGLLADRVGERLVLPIGLGTSAIALAGVGIAAGFTQLVLLLVASGALSASVNAASGRAVMHWFDPTERGLALGIRQTNVPLAGLVAALTLPALAAAAGLGWTYVILAAACAAGALAGAMLLRTPPGSQLPTGSRPHPARPLRTTAIWMVSAGSGLLVMGQTATMSFTVLFLNEGRGFSTGAAALVLAASQVVGGTLRILVGLWSDRLGTRIVPLCRLALAVSASLAVVGVVARSSAWVVVPVLAIAGAIGLSWNGLSFVAVAEIAGTAASGAALGLQQTVLGVGGIIAPITFAALVAGTSWQLAFLLAALLPLGGWALIRPLASGPRAQRVR